MKISISRKLFSFPRRRESSYLKIYNYQELFKH